MLVFVQLNVKTMDESCDDDKDLLFSISASGTKADTAAKGSI